VRFDLPADVAGVGAVRQGIVAAVGAWGFEATADLEVVLSELITNAIVHGRRPSAATCRLLDGGFIEVAVDDDGPGTPAVQAGDDRSTGGRGLAIVQALAVDWGVEPHDADGKRVWARLGTPSGALRTHPAADPPDGSG
jgi:anti-sigma regulatory factor (Ser/Thr protein kinase)